MIDHCHADSRVSRMCLLASARACGDPQLAAKACSHGLGAAVMRYAKACQAPVLEASAGRAVPPQDREHDGRGRRMSADLVGAGFDDDSSSVASGVRGGTLGTGFSGDRSAPPGTPDHARFFLRGDKLHDPKAYEEYVSSLFPEDLDERTVLAANVLYNLSCHEETKKYLIEGSPDVRLPRARAPATGESKEAGGARSKPLEGDALGNESQGTTDESRRASMNSTSSAKVPFQGAPGSRDEDAVRPGESPAADADEKRFGTATGDGVRTLLHLLDIAYRTLQPPPAP